MTLQGPDALKKSIDRMLSEANARMQAGKFSDAARSYKKAAQFADQALESMEDSDESRAMKIRATEYKQRSRSLERTGRADLSRVKPTDIPGDELAYSDEESDIQEQQILLLIDDTPRSIGWDTIGGHTELKKELKFHYGLAMAKFPKGVVVEGWQNIMFYGPPGTGKTLLACAIANKLNATFFNVKASQIVSKWVGESGKLISTLYRVARKLTQDGRPSIIFIDEFDALCKSRSLDGQLYHQQMLASILSEIDGFSNKGRRNQVLTIGATNRPWDLDAAVLSRFERRILIGLPDKQAREDIFRIHLEDRGLLVKSSSTLYKNLSGLTKGLTGREIARLCKEVTANMLAEMNPSIPRLVDKGLSSIQSYEIKLRPLEEADFSNSINKIIPDATSSDLEQYSKWGNREEK